MALVHHGDQAEWGHTEHLLAAVVDVLAEANWQRGGDKKQPHPKPIRRPGDPTRSRMSATDMRKRLLEQREGRGID